MTDHAVTQLTEVPDIWNFLILNGHLNFRLYAVYDKTFEGENFRGFCDFLLNHECFTLHSLLAIDIHYQKELLLRKFSFP